jgi:hypothetical protein
LAQVRCGATERANRILTELLDEKHADEETLGLLARTHKDLGLFAADLVERQRRLRLSRDLYLEAYRQHGGHWTGINAATLSTLLGEQDRGKDLAREVLDSLKKRQALEHRAGDAYWELATLGEAALNLEEWAEAEVWYTRAGEVGRKRFGDINSTRKQAKLLLVHLGRDPAERSLALRDLLTRFIAVCNTVAYAHSHGVIHRDLKPDNAMLGEYGETLVVDWGLAKRLDQPDLEQPPASAIATGAGLGSTPTRIGQVVGTPAFMPPEQARGTLDQIGPRSDVFSLGATLYCLLTGHAPYSGADTLSQAATGEVVPAQQRKGSVPPALEAVCARAMAAKLEDRYPTAKALADEVQRWLADEPVSAYREPLVDRARRWGASAPQPGELRRGAAAGRPVGAGAGVVGGGHRAGPNGAGTETGAGCRGSGANEPGAVGGEPETGED